MLKVTDLSFAVAGVKTEHVEFHLKQGDFFVLFGPDDSGKTELLNTILGLSKAYGGAVEINGKPLKKLSLAERKKIRFVPDEILMLYGMRVKNYLNSLAFSYKIVDKKIIRELVELFEIDEREYLTEMTYEGNKLVSIIGALISSPELLILDEPLNFLSEEMSGRLLSYLKGKCDEGMTLLLASEHFEDAEGFANSYFYLRDGEPVKTDKMEAGWIPPKKVVFSKVEKACLTEQFGEPQEEEGEELIYISNLSWEELGKRVSACGLEKNVTVKTARLEEILDVEYPAEKQPVNVPEELSEEEPEEEPATEKNEEEGGGEECSQEV